MNVLSLFDGMSCGRIALDRLGIPVDKYYASEIDKYATQVSEANYPDIIRLGDVCGVKAEDLEPIDLLIAGSPCQGFSFAGKQLAFDDPRSALFFEFVRLLKECKPKYFLLENVRMKKEFLDIISEQVGCEPIFINSALVSAQNRQRFYWTNIPGIEQPEQRGIVLRDILETDASNEYLAGENLQKNYKGGNQLNPNYKSQANTIHNDEGKSGTICAGTHGYANGYVKDFDKNLDKMTNKDGKAHCLTARYTAAQPENSMQRSQRSMIPVLQDDLKSLPLKSQTIKAQYAKSSKANFERSGTYHATGIQQKLTHDKPVKVGNIYPSGGQNGNIFSADGKSPTLSAGQGKTGRGIGSNNSPKIETHDKPIKVGMNIEEVKVRKHEVDVPNLQHLLKVFKSVSKKTNKQIAEETNLPVTKVEHWFRSDTSFAIPSDDVWFKLKEVIGITLDTFDAQIMEFEYRDGVYETKQRVYSENGKSPTLTAGNSEQYIETHDTPKQVGIAVDIKGHDQIKRVYSPDGKSSTLTTCGGGHREPKVITGGAFRGRAYDTEGKRMDKDGKSVANKTTQMLELRKDAKSNAITTVGKDSLVVSQGLEFSHGLENGRRLEDGKNLSRNYSEGSRVYKTSGRAATLTAQSKGGKGGHTGLYGDEVYWRKLTPLECMRLQTVQDDYLMPVSNTQKYKMLGNGWTIEVIAHIFKNMQLAEAGAELSKTNIQQTLDL